ncbi:CAP domain-containing protein [Lutibacter sp.]|uniref:CAP domain-containing protein n=1 Tax=Lutibacter sp. TaxID=1925666 RepID=UPI002732F9BD|nr:CAP domain-containing protein [Lutibacter sp.]MDP3313426.1 CAP domain-containing protein [Lutibacter sp.]
MKSLSPTIFCLLIFSFIFSSCSKEDDGIYFSETKETLFEKSSYSDIELEIFNLINNHRKSLNLSNLTPLNIVSGVANGHTKYMIEKGAPNHDNFMERTQILSKNANAKHVGENVAFGYNSAQGAVNGWLNSSTHKSLIENPYFTHFGISTERDANGRNYFTNIFITK